MTRMERIERGQQQGMQDIVEAVVRETPTYEGLRKTLHNLGFQAKETKPDLVRWESLEDELAVLIRMDAETGAVTDAEVLTFEEMERNR
ncbi:hypothetical protein FGU65_04065 [Methanoculleus sp. FWC-SCC1]|uniref:Uncharacterized protein n=1 Tax=Methanoculleus frigidifontis TaxID=2584085 RepID=A0ABT8M809_9EURY|nr:hypothetical protein [Methanoculleus sp. FWC-SCC1]MDN7024072.1 hypothetical protein [Methanoculleus sp. FWC-SCC1]